MNRLERVERRMLKRRKTIELLTQKQQYDMSIIGSYVGNNYKIYKTKAKIMSAALNVCGLKSENVFRVYSNGKMSRNRYIVDCRKLYFYLCKMYTPQTLKEIGKIEIGGKVVHTFDHATVIHNINSIETLADVEPNIRGLIDRAKKLLSV